MCNPAIMFLFRITLGMVELRKFGCYGHSITYANKRLTTVVSRMRYKHR